jgi:hypothetical protein
MRRVGAEAPTAFCDASALGSWRRSIHAGLKVLSTHAGAMRDLQISLPHGWFDVLSYRDPVPGAGRFRVSGLRGSRIAFYPNTT